MRNTILSDEIIDKLCITAHKKAKEMKIDISFAIYDENGLPLLFRRYGEAPVISTKLVPGKAYTSSVMFMPTQKLAKLCTDGGPLMGLENKDPKITLISGGYPLFVEEKCVGGIGVGGGRNNEDNIIAEHVIKVFNEEIYKTGEK
ncbi:MAG: heme-binding protein [Methanosphaera sp.]|uniref:GlcG/HbpS family heme-binding protein n=1 Tax=Methanosphaera sp. ISO3-F5 TaxID=1452353 RepID=UPI002B2585A4|nr:heme-binding protein [Methanosphaera sp. ISO3-F5]MBR0472345.1 heme-binding protein [Methanosphaera sp.]WQH63890.1 heme-binding protein [Methanosphaera sp. ISO3-F5]